MRRPIFAFLILLTLIPAVRPAAAHPADEAGVYHYLWIEARPGQIELQHAAVVGGLLTQAVWPDMDQNGDGVLSDAEQRRFAEELAGEVRLRINGRRVAWELADQVFPSKEEFFGRNMAAITLRLHAPLPKATKDGDLISLQDDTFSTFTGIFPKPVIKPGSLSASEPLVSERGRLMEFRLAAAGATLDRPFKPDAAPPNSPSPNSPSATLPAMGNAPDLANAPIFPDRGKVLYATKPGAHSETAGLKEFLHRPLSPLLIVLGLGAALLAGMVHALSPGHGKSMVAAYLVGTRGTTWDAVLLGIVVTITHTFGVYVLGALCLWLTRQIRAEVVGQWLSLTSGILVLGMGFWLFQRGLLAYYGLKPLPGHSHGPGGHSHGHAHSHVEAHSHAPEAHSHAHEAHSHAHEAHSHAHEAHSHAHEAHSDAHSCDAAVDPSKSAGPPTDSPLDGYAIPATGDRRSERKGLIWLGVAGGIVPCFDALAILIAAVNLGRIELGLALIAAFSVGMALVLVAIGILFVKARGLVQRFSGEAKWVKVLPAVSGAVLSLLGAWLTFQSLMQAGVLHLS